MTGSDITNLLERKRRRRNIEYVGLIALQGFFVGSFARSLVLLPSIGAMIATGGMAWTLTQYREKRRTLPESNRYRIIADVMETFGLLLSLVGIAIAAHSLDIPVLLYQAHLSLMLMAYFASTLGSETLWMKKIFPTLNTAQQLNYLVNLNSSLILPFSWTRMKKALRLSSKRD